MRSIIAKRSKDKMVEDEVFTAAKVAQEAVAKYGDKAVDATLGVLADEHGKLVTFDEVWNTYLNIDRRSCWYSLYGFVLSTTMVPHPQRNSDYCGKRNLCTCPTSAQDFNH